MGAELSILLDIRRIKQGSVYPLRLKVYYGGKTDLHQTIYDLTKDDFRKFDAKRISNALAELRDKINDLRTKAQVAANGITPFDFKRFYQEFIYGHPLFKERKTKVQALLTNPQGIIYPDKWVKKFPVLQEEHPGPDCLSIVYYNTIKSLSISATQYATGLPKPRIWFFECDRNQSICQVQAIICGSADNP